MTTTDRFEDRLLTELRAVVAQRPAPAAAPAPEPTHHRPPRLVLGGLATAIAAVAAVVGLSVGGSSEPAYAVDRQADGDVTVTINRLSDAEGLQSKLRAAGLPAVVRYTPPGKMCVPPDGAVAPSRSASPRQKLTTQASTSQGGKTTFTISRDSVGPGQTLLISTSGGGTGVSSIGIAVIPGSFTSCDLVDAPAGPPPAPGSPDNGPSFHTGP